MGKAPCPRSDCDGKLERFKYVGGTGHRCKECSLVPEWSDNYDKRNIDKSSSSGGPPDCFITTAVSSDESVLMPLRSFRDEVMKPNIIGRFLLLIYDVVAPPIAVSLSQNQNSLLEFLIRFCSNIAEWRERQSMSVIRSVTSVVLIFLYIFCVIFASFIYIFHKLTYS